MKNSSVPKLLSILLVLSLLAACSPVQTSTPAANANQPTPKVVIAIPIISGEATLPAANPTPEDKGINTVTLAQKGQTISLHVGETFLLNLGDDVYQWDVALDDATTVSRQVNIAVIKGAQGIYQAHQIGKATLTASGDPLCRQSKPPCGMPTTLFTIKIEVIA